MKLTRLLVIAAQVRFLLLVLQYVANYLIPDHDAQVFTYPQTTERKTIWDNLISSLFGGLIRWDGQYFMHIALYGYTYENSLAFFPLLPFSVHYLAKITQLPFINFESQVLLTFVLFNFTFFLLTTFILYKLTENWFGKHRAQLTTLLFCVNPASIFFSAAYTESLFAFLTFSSIYCCWKIEFNKFLASSNWLFLSCFLISLSSLTRSNGLLNVGFLVYFFVRNLRNHLTGRDRANHLCFKLLKLSCNLCVLVFSVIICSFPFIQLQFYHWENFCFDNNWKLPQEILEHGLRNDYLMKGHFNNQSWCNFKYIPLAYSYVQNNYWDVGFFKYYQFKQLPNFLLALPVIYITLSECLRFLSNNKGYLIHLGIFKSIYNEKCKKNEENSRENDLLFVCVMHALFLCVFSLFFVHIQVTTRMLFSANPAIYWFCLNKNQKFIKLYCFSYYFIGIVMFSNFLPWT